VLHDRTLCLKGSSPNLTLILRRLAQQNGEINAIHGNEPDQLKRHKVTLQGCEAIAATFTNPPNHREESR